jgi:hypothetical protein
MSSISSFDRLAAARYPYSGDYNHDVHQDQLRQDYIKALWQCKTSPAYYVTSPWGEFTAHCEPLTIDDIHGWQKVTSRRKIHRARTPDYGGY